MQQYGTTAFENLVKSSISFVSFKINYLRLGKNLQDESGKEEYVKSVLKELSLLQDAMQAESYLKSLIARVFLFNGNTFESIAPISQRTKGTAKTNKAGF